MKENQHRLFVEALRDWTRITEEEKRAAAWFHQATFLWLRFAAEAYQEVKDSDLPVEHLSPADPLVHSLQRRLWAFLQAVKLALDSLGREINLVYWGLDPERRFFNPLVKMRWTSFYTVRERLLGCDEFRDDPLYQLLKRKTRSEAADQVYLDVSHLVNLSLIGPPTIGRVDLRAPMSAEIVKVSDASVWLADDPREQPYTYDRRFEVNRLFKDALDWLEMLADAVYDTLHIKLGSEE